MLKIFKLTGTTVYLTIWPDCWLKTFFERGGGGYEYFDKLFKFEN